MIRLAHFITHPIQYFAPLYRQMALDPSIELTVYFGSDFGLRSSYDPGFEREIQFDVPLLEGYSSEFLPNRGRGVPDGRYWSFDCPRIEEVLRRGKTDCIWIHGWGYRANWQAIRAARRLGIPYFLRAETHDGTRSATPLRSLARRILVGRALREAAGCLYVGQRNRAFYRSLGVSVDRLFPAHYSVDAQRFHESSRSDGTRQTTRAKLGATDDTTVVISVAKAIPRKRLDDVIRAVGRCSEKVCLWIVGEGPQRPQLEALAQEAAPGRVAFLGFVNQSEIPRIFAGADVFVLASDDEPWGLVVNEAMACGLPVIVSHPTGCAPDLIVEDSTGKTFPAGNIAALREAIETLSTDRELAKRWGHNAQQRVISEFDTRTTARQILAAVASVVEHRRMECCH